MPLNSLSNALTIKIRPHKGSFFIPKCAGVVRRFFVDTPRQFIFKNPKNVDGVGIFRANGGEHWAFTIAATRCPFDFVKKIFRSYAQFSYLSSSSSSIFFFFLIFFASTKIEYKKTKKIIRRYFGIVKQQQQQY